MLPLLYLLFVTPFLYLAQTPEILWTSFLHTINARPVEDVIRLERYANALEGLLNEFQDYHDGAMRNLTSTSEPDIRFLSYRLIDIPWKLALAAAAFWMFCLVISWLAIDYAADAFPEKVSIDGITYDFLSPMDKLHRELDEKEKEIQRLNGVMESESQEYQSFKESQNNAIAKYDKEAEELRNKHKENIEDLERKHRANLQSLQDQHKSELQLKADAHLKDMRELKVDAAKDKKKSEFVLLFIVKIQTLALRKNRRELGQAQSQHRTDIDRLNETVKTAQEEHDEEMRKMKEEHERKLKEAREKEQQEMMQTRERHEREMREMQCEHERQMEEAEEQCTKKLRKVEGEYDDNIKAMQGMHAKELKEMEEGCLEQIEESQEDWRAENQAKLALQKDLEEKDDELKRKTRELEQKTDELNRKTDATEAACTERDDKREELKDVEQELEDEILRTKRLRGEISHLEEKLRMATSKTDSEIGSGNDAASKDALATTQDMRSENGDENGAASSGGVAPPTPAERNDIAPDVAADTTQNMPEGNGSLGLDSSEQASNDDGKASNDSPDNAPSTGPEGELPGATNGDDAGPPATEPSDSNTARENGRTGDGPPANAPTGPRKKCSKARNEASHGPRPGPGGRGGRGDRGGRGGRGFPRGGRALRYRGYPG